MEAEADARDAEALAKDAEAAEAWEETEAIAIEALEAAAAEILEAEAIAADTLAEASDMIEETSTDEAVTVGLKVTVAVTVVFKASKAEETFPPAKSEATTPVVGNPVNDEP